ncbi:hypothetical protein H6P81_018571 [Aristolochia fimbriata]|uniref:Uncharacterized protein n=1 Tax=Aristolochia fimbriata TaxID=158543 RepID=A0AAV7E1R5_ARIFI|nr:hypothetical protein H6P81_018571 [Aristolochia fimbriata]
MLGKSSLVRTQKTQKSEVKNPTSRSCNALLRFLVSSTLSSYPISALSSFSSFCLQASLFFWDLLLRMENQVVESAHANSRVKVTFRLGSEVSSVNSTKGCLSDQLVTMKEGSMAILKDYITKHNVPTDVPDEPLEGTSEDESDEIAQPPGISKKRK